jgi:ABC-type amino acid transport substrate-binding protein
MLAAAMPCPRRQFLTLVTIPALGGAVPGAVATLRMVSETLPPYVLPEDHPLGEGIDVDIARQALGAQGGLPIRLERLPWRRALALLESGEADLAPGVRRTAERERFLAFSQPYGSVVRHRAYSAREVRFSVRRSADLAQWHVGLVEGYAYPESLLAALGARVSRLPDEPALLRVAAAGRVDVALGDRPARPLGRAAARAAAGAAAAPLPVRGGPSHPDGLQPQERACDGRAGADEPRPGPARARRLAALRAALSASRCPLESCADRSRRGPRASAP